ncbi:hypothetical protein DSLASN_09140 [Desulfoluna limicola]|uniref:Uncharacterized protein n=1 Tax=Desulfoluna limicola TaxID=2810562 RepID=A0ABN6F1F5_9BACT|nr:hypothetical protein DSLASN_09140 [Desulfoluna limicola]
MAGLDISNVSVVFRTIECGISYFAQCLQANPPENHDKNMWHGICYIPTSVKVDNYG